jgi:hypothetical protein
VTIHDGAQFLLDFLIVMVARDAPNGQPWNSDSNDLNEGGDLVPKEIPYFQFVAGHP